MQKKNTAHRRQGQGQCAMSNEQCAISNVQLFPLQFFSSAVLSFFLDGATTKKKETL